MNKHQAKAAPRGQRQREAGFTLIELLTVISIIALLAAIGAGLSGTASRKARESGIRAELGKLVTAIESYHADFNQYPPDNHYTDPNDRNSVIVRPALNQLYYELVGTYVTNNGSLYLTADNEEKLTSAEIKAAFHTGGFVNAIEATRAARTGATSRQEQPKSFLRDLKKGQRAEIRLPGAGDIEILTVPRIDWPTRSAEFQKAAPLAGLVTDPKMLAVNPWHYNSSRPTHNPGTFDLWAVWPTGRLTNGVPEFRIIGNWKD